MKLAKIIIAAVLAVLAAWAIAELIGMIIKGFFWILFIVLVILIAIPIFNWIKKKIL